jgi:fermentation-respiration switch protein FrsA (DUF1100 family)
VLGRIASEGTRPAGLVSLAGMTLPLPQKVLEQTRYLVALDGDVSPEEQAHLDRTEAAVTALNEALAAESPETRPGLLGAPFAFYEDLAAHDAARETAALGIPILALQGARDYQVTLEDFALWENALEGSRDACLVTYEGLDHLFREGTGPSRPTDYHRPGPMSEAPIDDLAAWILRRDCP